MQKQYSAAATIRSTVTWLADPAGILPEPAVGQSLFQHSIPLPDAIGKGALETIRLAPGFHVTRSTHRFKRDLPAQQLPIAEARLDLPEPAFIVHSARVGNAVVNIDAVSEKLPLNNTISVFQHVKRHEHFLSVDTSQNIQMTTLIIRDSVLSTLCGDGAARMLLSALRLQNVSSASSFDIPHRISNTLHTSLLTTLGGEIRVLFAKAKVLEYLSLLANHAVARRTNLNNPRREQLMRELYDELISLDGKAPSLKELASRYAMSTKTLNESFRQAHGQTISAFVAEHRLNDAHAALQDSDIPIKVLAARFGYSHANNFITAFRRKFGYPPGSLRRDASRPPDGARERSTPQGAPRPARRLAISAAKGQ